MTDKTWCEHVKWLDGRWRQTGPLDDIIDVIDVHTWENLCSICGAKRPEEPKKLWEKLFHVKSSGGEAVSTYSKKLAQTAIEHVKEIAQLDALIGEYADPRKPVIGLDDLFKRLDEELE